MACQPRRETLIDFFFAISEFSSFEREPLLSFSLFLSLHVYDPNSFAFPTHPGKPSPHSIRADVPAGGIKKPSFSFYPFFRFPASCVAKFEEGKLQAKLSFFKVVGSNFPLLPLPLSILIWCRAAAVAPLKESRKVKSCRNGKLDTFWSCAQTLEGVGQMMAPPPPLGMQAL